MNTKSTIPADSIRTGCAYVLPATNKRFRVLSVRSAGDSVLTLALQRGFEVQMHQLSRLNAMLQRGALVLAAEPPLHLGKPDTRPSNNN